MKSLLQLARLSITPPAIKHDEHPLSKFAVGASSNSSPRSEMHAQGSALLEMPDDAAAGSPYPRA